ncbi:MAG: hypothetical protein HOP29_08370 [Phycisphaerales bacterium]|nr:hypothetical protein [Phycisphaerales bacterium]
MKHLSLQAADSFVLLTAVPFLGTVDSLDILLHSIFRFGVVGAWSSVWE